ncbi:MAG: hypothetical protein NTZ49_04810 [Candidatus Parcubacteria bacterium]|nr:hypothetical protein [Candidatus Parcubacteria bacterium]
MLTQRHPPQNATEEKEGNKMRKKDVKGGKEKKLQPSDSAEALESRWLVGKCLLNGGNNLRPDLQALLDSLAVEVTRIVTNRNTEPMVCIKGPKATVNALVAIAKGKVV